MQENPKLLVPEHLKNIESCRIVNDGNPDDEWTPCLWYAKLNGDRVPLVGKTELMVVSGEEKARKSLFLNIIIASRFGYVGRNRTCGFELLMEEPILYFDTEQPRRRVKKNRIRYQNIIEHPLDDDNTFIQYSLRGKTPHVMKECITHVIEDMVAKSNPPGVIIIDQIMDLSDSRDENDMPTSVALMDMINLWSDMTGALMVVAIHTNRGGERTRGKLGSLLDKKTDCSFLLNMDKETWVTTLTHTFSREGRMPPITFDQDYSGLPNFLDERGPKTFFN